MFYNYVQGHDSVLSYTQIKTTNRNDTGFGLMIFFSRGISEYLQQVVHSIVAQSEYLQVC